MNHHNWNGSYGYGTKHSNYSNEKHSNKTETDVGVGTRQQTLKRCGVVKQDRQWNSSPSNDSFRSCETGTCPWR